MLPLSLTFWNSDPRGRGRGGCRDFSFLPPQLSLHLLCVLAQILSYSDFCGFVCVLILDRITCWLSLFVFFLCTNPPTTPQISPEPIYVQRNLGFSFVGYILRLWISGICILHFQRQYGKTLSRVDCFKILPSSIVAVSLLVSCKD